jgi:hypothetical protein
MVPGLLLILSELASPRTVARAETLNCHEPDTLRRKHPQHPQNLQHTILPYRYHKSSARVYVVPGMLPSAPKKPASSEYARGRHASLTQPRNRHRYPALSLSTNGERPERDKNNDSGVRTKTSAHRHVIPQPNIDVDEIQLSNPAQRYRAPPSPPGSTARRAQRQRWPCLREGAR